mmetsp:Transcript_12590/g.30388  ORF Transcript_12590/g.30388 Transcript_12590/m.30388 type:complete len:221 (-) Transcript_12590:828-1490(-)
MLQQLPAVRVRVLPRQRRDAYVDARGGGVQRSQGVGAVHGVVVAPGEGRARRRGAEGVCAHRPQPVLLHAPPGDVEVDVAGQHASDVLGDRRHRRLDGISQVPADLSPVARVRRVPRLHRRLHHQHHVLQALGLVALVDEQRHVPRLQAQVRLQHKHWHLKRAHPPRARRLRGGGPVAVVRLVDVRQLPPQLGAVYPVHAPRLHLPAGTQRRRRGGAQRG